MSYTNLNDEVLSFMARVNERYEATAIVVGIRTLDSSEAEGGGFWFNGDPLQNYANCKRHVIRTETEWANIVPVDSDK